MKKIVVIFSLIIFLASILRLYHLLSNPVSLYWDETSILYNAYSINLTGKDEWGNRMPLVFESFGDYKLPFFVYLVAFFQKIVGYNDLAVRLPSALAGILTVAVIPFLVTRLKLSWKVGLLAAFLLAISSWHLQFSRAGFEANVSLFLTANAILFFLKEKFLISFCFFVASAYTYHSAALTAPMIILLLFSVFFKRVWNLRKRVLIALVISGLILLPYLPNYIFSATGRIRFTAESVNNEKGNVIIKTVNNYVANFSTDYLFFKGDQNGRHSVKKIGELYLWQLPVLLAGIYFLIKYRSKTSFIVLGILLIGAFPPALTRVSPHALRGLLSVWPYQIVSAIGLVFLLSKLPKIFKFLVIPIVIYMFIHYLHLYYVHYPKAYAPDWQDGQKQTVEYLAKIEANYDRILISDDLYPIYLLWYLKYDPSKLQADSHFLKKIGKFEYADLTRIPQKLSLTEKDIMVVPTWMGIHLTPEPIREIRTTYKEPVFRIYEY